MRATITNTSPMEAVFAGGIVVRPLAGEDMPAFRALCERLPMRTLTPQLNIEVHGFQGNIVRSWGAFNAAQTELAGLLIRYGNTVVAVDCDGRCASAFARVIDGERNIAGVRGSIEIVTGIQALLRRYSPTDWKTATS